MKLFKSKKKCPICLQRISFYHKSYTTICEHKFHRECAKDWLWWRANENCPVCRKKQRWKNPDSFLDISGY